MGTVDLSVDRRGVAQLALARPDSHNAMNGAMIEELTGLAARLGRDPAVRVVVLTGAGPSFCAGADLGWMRAQMAAPPAERAAAALALAGLLGALDALPKPLIGRVQGNAFGGGIGLMAVCDAVIGADSARFGLTEVRLGLIPATIGPYVVARMGAAAARRVFASGRVFGAQEAVALGIVARAVPLDDLDAAVAAEVAPYLAAAPGAVAAAKAQVRSLGPQIDAEMVARSVEALLARWESPEAAEGIAAFFDKRKPGWADG